MIILRQNYYVGKSCTCWCNMSATQLNFDVRNMASLATSSALRWREETGFFFSLESQIKRKLVASRVTAASSYCSATSMSR